MRGRKRKSGFRRLLTLSTFVVVTLGIVFIGEMTQAIAESWSTRDEKAMLADVNAHRTSHHLKALKSDAGLQMVARKQAQRMVLAGMIFHNPNYMMEASAAVPNWLQLGENVGMGADEPSVEEAFLASPHHRENIEDKLFNLIGIGALGTQDGTLFFTQDFAQTGGSTVKKSTKPKTTTKSSPKPKTTNKAKPASTPTKKATKPAVKKPAKPVARVAATQQRAVAFPPAPANGESKPLGLLSSLIGMIGHALSKFGHLFDVITQAPAVTR